MTAKITITVEAKDVSDLETAKAAAEKYIYTAKGLRELDTYFNGVNMIIKGIVRNLMYLKK